MEVYFVVGTVAACRDLLPIACVMSFAGNLQCEHFECFGFLIHRHMLDCAENLGSICYFLSKSFHRLIHQLTEPTDCWKRVNERK